MLTLECRQYMLTIQITSDQMHPFRCDDSGSSISEITARAGMPQSHVSETVARLREQGTVESFPDPADRRRTLVRVSAQHPKNVMRAALVPVDAALAAALSELSPDEAADIIKTLEALAARLRPDKPGPILDQLNRASDERTQE
jgi:DNA-binding MarR family transcriptional regulator